MAYRTAEENARAAAAAPLHGLYLVQPIPRAGVPFGEHVHYEMEQQMHDPEETDEAR